MKKNIEIRFTENKNKLQNINQKKGKIQLKTGLK